MLRGLRSHVWSGLRGYGDQLLASLAVGWWWPALVKSNTTALLRFRWPWSSDSILTTLKPVLMIASDCNSIIFSYHDMRACLFGSQTRNTFLSVCFVGNMQCTVGSRLWCKFVCFHSKHNFYDTWRYSEAAPHYQSQQDGAPGGPLKFDSLDGRGSFCFEVWCTFFLISCRKKVSPLYEDF